MAFFPPGGGWFVRIISCLDLDEYVFNTCIYKLFYCTSNADMVRDGGGFGRLQTDIVIT